jgi:hypothetical protein
MTLKELPHNVCVCVFLVYSYYNKMLGVVGKKLQTIGLGYGTKNEENKVFLKGGNLCFL